MNSETKEKLRAKLVDTCVNLQKLEDDKKAYTSSYAEQIKGAKKRINSLSQAIKSDDLKHLFGSFDESELEGLK